MTSQGRTPSERSRSSASARASGRIRWLSSVATRRGGARPLWVVFGGGAPPVRRPAAAGDVERLVEAMVDELGRVDRAAALGVPRLAGGDDGGQIGETAAGRERPGGLSRIADRLGEP